MTSDGALAIVERGVVFAPTSANNNPQLGGVGVTSVTNAGTTGVFTVNVTGLIPATDYIFAVYATNSIGTSYSLAGSFLTSVAPATTLVINEVYGGGGAAGASYLNDFVELYNGTASNINLATYSLQYTSATGNTWSTAKLNLTGSIGAGQTYLIKLASSGAVGAALTTENISGSINMSATTGKVALVSNQTALTVSDPHLDPSVVDFVGYGTSANAFETAVAPAPSAANSISRSARADTNNNSADFLAGTPTPGIATAPLILSSTIPLDNVQAVSPGANLVAMFSEAVVKGTSGNIVIKKTSDGSVFETISVTSAQVTVAGAAVTIDPSGTLAADTEYYVVMDAGVFKAAASSLNVYAGLSSTTVWSFSTTVPSPSGLVINEVYGGGGNTGASYLNDFVELYNSTAASVDLSTYSLQYSSATGSTWSTGKLNLTGIIGANQTYLIKLASSGAVGAALPAENIAGSINLSATTGKVALVRNQTVLTSSDPQFDSSVVDFVGYGTSANAFETATAPAPSAATSISRASRADTNNNSADFATATPSPGIATSVLTLASTVPADNSASVFINTNLVATFSESVVKGTSGNIVIKKTSDGSVFETIPVTSPQVTVVGANVTIDPSGTFAPSTEYYVVMDAAVFKASSNALNAYAGLSSTTAWSFTAALLAPSINSTTFASITMTSAVLGGNVTSDGGASLMERGVVYAPSSVNGNPQLGGLGVLAVSATGSLGGFTVNVGGLTPGTAYSFAAYATNSVGTTHSSLSTFTTLQPEIALYLGTDDTGPALTDAQAAAIDFGVTPLGAPLTRSFTAKNTGTADLHLTTLSLPGGYETVGSFLPLTLTPGSTCTFQVRFLANSTGGVLSGALALLSDDADEGSFDLSLSAKASPVANAAALDLTFNGSAKVVTAMGNFTSAVQAMAVQPDGKLVAVGYGQSSNSGNTIAIGRYNVDGTLDPSFGTAGKVFTDVADGEEYGASVAIQSDGKIVVAAAVGGEIGLVRYASNGALDPTFGTAGKLMTTFVTPLSFGGAYSYPNAMALQSDGKILVAGVSNLFNENGFTDFILLRYNTDGTPDPTFNSTGWVTTSVGNGYCEARGLVVQSDGKIVVAGSAQIPGNSYDFAMVRYETNGNLDATFGNAGKVSAAFGAGIDTARAVVLQPDGKLVLAGYASNGTNYDFALARFTSGGLLDTTFNGTGKTSTALGASDDTAFAVALQSDGSLVAAGSTFNGTNNDFGLVRYTSAGLLDTTFNGTGKLTTAVGPGNDEAAAIVALGDGRLVVGGKSYQGGVPFEFAIVRYGTLVQPTLNMPSASTFGIPNMASFLGSVNPNGVITQAWFEYGLTTSYGHTTLQQSLGYGATVSTLMGAASDLAPATFYHFRIVAQNSIGTFYGPDATFQSALNNNATLSNLTTSAGTLNPLFDGTHAYFVTVAHELSEVAIIPTPTDPAATVRVNGFMVAGMSPFTPLTVGYNPFTVEVTAQNGTMKETYTVGVTRAASSNANLSNLSFNTSPLTPTFDPAVTSYAVALPQDAISLMVSALTADMNARISVMGPGFTPSTYYGGFSGSTSMAGLTGSDSFSFMVTAEDNLSFKTYTVLVTRQTAVEAWKQNWFGSAANSGTSSDTADPFHTGVSNLTVFSFFGPIQNPALVRPNQLPQPQTVGSNLVMSFSEPSGVSGITYGAEYSPTMASGSWLPVTDTGSGTTHTFSVPVGSFLRLSVTN